MPIDCWECSALGDDYYMDEDGEWIPACDTCPNNQPPTDTNDDSEDPSFDVRPATHYNRSNP